MVVKQQHVSLRNKRKEMVMGIKKVTHFKCDGCKSYKKLKERKIVNASVTSFGTSGDEFACYHHHVQLCKDCQK